jgi:hypothetical protein
MFESTSSWRGRIKAEECYDHCFHLFLNTPYLHLHWDFYIYKMKEKPKVEYKLMNVTLGSCRLQKKAAISGRGSKSYRELLP